MDLSPEQLQNLSLPSIFKESISIPKRSPQTFYRITLSLILPLSFAILAHSFFTHPILDQLHENPSASHASQWTKLLFYQFCYLVSLLGFSLLSTAAVVFTVASLYTSKQVSFSSIITAMPSILRRLFVTFMWVFPYMEKSQWHYQKHFKRYCFPRAYIMHEHSQNCSWLEETHLYW